MIRIPLNPVDTVIAAVTASSLATAIAGMVVVTQVHDALQARSPADPMTAEAAAARDMPPPTEAIARRYPIAHEMPALTAPLTFTDSDIALLRDPPRPADAARDMALGPAVFGTLGRGEVEAAPNGALVVAARNASPEAALGWRTPLARPGFAIGTPPVEAAPAAEPPSPVLVATSPRPLERPAEARLPVRVTARAAAPSDRATVEVARAEPPGASLAPPRMGDGTNRARLFPPRDGANPCSGRLANGIPRRPGRAAAGSTVLAAIGNGSGSDRDSALIGEAMAGNVPSYLRNLQPVRFEGIAGGRQTEIVICVTPDYLAVGSDGDHVRVPLGLPAALRVADAFEMMLPTTRMVDAIYAQADLRLSPRPMSPGPQMSSTDYFRRHDRTVDGQFAEAGGRHGMLVAGHKKDLVIANRLARNRGRVAIYGWHRSHGDPIQPLSTVHGAYYADYSHGIRLVSRTAYVDGRPMDLRALLTSGTYAAMLNSDGPLSSATVQLASL
jgi:hypothetical protein